MEPILNIIKSQTPIIWIDTSAIINMTLLRTGRLKDRAQIDRYKFLYESIIKHTRSGKLICPLANQDEEIWAKRNEWFETMEELSLGIRTDPELEVYNRILKIFIDSYFSNKTVIHLHSDLLFDFDPASELLKTLSDPFHITIHEPLIGGPEKTKTNKEQLNHNLEKIRKDNITTDMLFEQQRENEYMAEFNVIRQALAFPQDLKKSGWTEEEIYWTTLQAKEFMTIWEQVSSQYTHKRNIYDFFKSQYYRKIPSKRISCELSAKIMTDRQAMRSGDAKDIEHISNFLPFSNIFITDKQRRTQIRKLKFDTEYNTKVCYIGDVCIIRDFFNSL